jgi:MFS family permease
VWGALFASLAGAVLCIGLAIRRPRRRRAVAADVAPETLVRRWVFGWRGSEPSARTALLVSLAMTLLWAAVIGPIAGLVVGLLTILAARDQNRRWLLAFSAPAALAIAAAYVVLHQIRYHPTSAFEWPGDQSAVHQVAWVAVALLVSLVTLDHLWDRRRPPPT